MSSERPQDPHTPRQYTSEQAWQPVPQGGDYDADATAFVQLPDGFFDSPSGMPAGVDPLAAPGHGYVPPPMETGEGAQSVPPAASAEPGPEGQWTMPFAGPEPGREQDRGSASTAGSGSPGSADGGRGAAPPGEAVPWTAPVAEESPDESGDYLPGGGNRTGETGRTEWHDQRGRIGQWQDQGAASPEQWHHGHHGADDAARHSDPAGHWPSPAAAGHQPHETSEPGATPSHGTEASYGTQGTRDSWRAPDSASSGHSGQWTVQYGSDGHGGASHDDAADRPSGTGEGNPSARDGKTPEPVSQPDAAQTSEAREGREDPEAGPGSDAGGDTPEPTDGSPGHQRVSRGADATEEPRAGGGSAPLASHDDPGGFGDLAASGTVPGIVAEPETPSAEDFHSEHAYVSYVLTVNGFDRPVADAWIGESLLYVLRERLGLAGAKDGCSQGECGACSVQVDGRLVASCLVPAATSAGSDIRTVEGLPVDGLPSDVQRAIAESGAVQCGFCVPGLTMTVHDLLKGNHAPTELETRQAICGNLCRCSGYQGVLQAVRQVVAGRAASAEAQAGEETDPDGSPVDPAGDAPHVPHQTTSYGGGSTGDFA